MNKDIHINTGKDYKKFLLAQISIYSDLKETFNRKKYIIEVNKAYRKCKSERLEALEQVMEDLRQHYQSI